MSRSRDWSSQDNKMNCNKIQRGIYKDKESREWNRDDDNRFHHNHTSSSYQNKRYFDKDCKTRTIKEEQLYQTKSGVYLNKNFYRRDRRYYEEESVIENYVSNGDNNTTEVLSDILSKINDDPKLSNQLYRDNNPSSMSRERDSYGTNTSFSRSQMPHTNQFQEHYNRNQEQRNMEYYNKHHKMKNEEQYFQNYPQLIDLEDTSFNYNQSQFPSRKNYAENVQLIEDYPPIYKDYQNSSYEQKRNQLYGYPNQKQPKLVDAQKYQKNSKSSSNNNNYSNNNNNSSNYVNNSNTLDIYNNSCSSYTTYTNIHSSYIEHHSNNNHLNRHHNHHHRNNNHLNQNSSATTTTTVNSNSNNETRKDNQNVIEIIEISPSPEREKQKANEIIFTSHEVPQITQKQPSTDQMKQLEWNTESDPLPYIPLPSNQHEAEEKNQIPMKVETYNNTIISPIMVDKYFEAKKLENELKLKEKAEQQHQQQLLNNEKNKIIPLQSKITLKTYFDLKGTEYLTMEETSEEELLEELEQIFEHFNSKFKDLHLI